MRSAAVHNPSPKPLDRFRPPVFGERILVAVSGGVDSMVLLHFLKTLSKTHHWKLTVAHFNHCLRGRASDADEVFVRKTAATMKLPYVAGSADVKKFTEQSGLSIEMAARKLRHEFFAKTARERKIRTVAIAHHADDQVELFFLRLLRGAGGGLAGMKWRSPSPADRTISLVRPLLDVSKVELEQFAREHKIRYREDATNLSADFLRNRIRRELLPLLRKHYQPALNKVILRMMEIVGAESDFVSETAKLWLHARRRRNDFGKLSVAVQRQVLKRQLIEHGVEADFELIEHLRNSPNKPVNLGVNVSILRDAKGRVGVRESRAAAFNDKRLAVNLNEASQMVFEGVKFSWKLSARRKDQGQFRKAAGKSGTEYFDADKAGREVVLRHWRAGDRFQPIGMKSAVKLQDFFTNQKISRERRHHMVVAEAGSEIFWVEGLRISENFKVTPKTKRLLIWRWRR